MNGEATALHRATQPRKIPGRWETRLVILFLFFSEVIRNDLVPYVIPTIKLLNYVFIGFLVIRHFKKVVYILNRDLLLAIVVSITLLSFFWSANPDQTARLLMALVRGTLFGLYLAACYPLKEQFRIFSWLAGLIIIVNFAFCVLVPAYGLTPNPNGSGMVWSGIYTFKQFFGRIVAFATSICLVNAIGDARRRWWIVTFLLGVAMLWFSKSMTYLTAVLLAVSLIPLYAIVKQQYRSRTVLLCLSILMTVSVGYLVYVNLQTILVEVLGKNVNLNGRLPIWTLAIEQLMKNPWFGYGYTAFWGSDYGIAIAMKTWATGLKLDWSAWHAHNAFLDLALQIGVVGVGVLSLHIVVVLRRVIRLLFTTQSLVSFWMLCLLCIQLFAAIGEAPTYLSTFSVYWVIYVAISGSAMLELARIDRGYVTRTSSEATVSY